MVCDIKFAFLIESDSVSVLDMARHIPLYRSVLQLLRAIAQNSQLVSLLLPQNRAKHKEVNIANTDNLSVVSLLTKMNTCVDTYATRLRWVSLLNKLFNTLYDLVLFSHINKVGYN